MIDERENNNIYDLRDAEEFRQYGIVGRIGGTIAVGIGEKIKGKWIVNWYEGPEEFYFSRKPLMGELGITEPEIVGFTPLLPPIGFSPRPMKIMQDLRDAGVIDENNKWER